LGEIHNVVGGCPDVLGRFLFLAGKCVGGRGPGYGAAAAFAAVALWMERRKYHRKLQLLAQQASKRPVAIAVGVGKPGDIRGTVESYLKDQGFIMELFSIARPGNMSVDDALQVIKEFTDLKGKLTAQVGPTQIHFFYAGPVAVAASLGAILDNWVPAIVYDYDKGTYHPMLQLDRVLTSGKPNR